MFCAEIPLLKEKYQDGPIFAHDQDLTQPLGLAIDESGQYLFVSVSESDSIAVFNAQNFTFIREFGGRGSSPGKFGGPQGLAVTKEGNLVVMDYYNNRGQIVDFEGNSKSIFGQQGPKYGELYHPFVVAIDLQDNFLVVDEQYRVGVFSPMGRWQRDIAEGTQCHGIAIDFLTGNMVLAEPNEGRLKILSGTGEPIRIIQHINPFGVTVDRTGRIVFGDPTDERVWVVSSQGDVLMTMDAGPNARLSIPVIGKNGVLYVTDTCHNCVQVFH